MPDPGPGTPGGEPLLVFVDVSDTLGSGWRAGIQRVVVQLVDHLRHTDVPVRLVPLVWSRALRGHRYLTDSELTDLLGSGVRAHPPRWSGGGDTIAARWLTGARRLAGRAVRLTRWLLLMALTVTRLRAPLRELLRVLSLKTIHRDQLALAVGELPAGSVLFDLDTVWNQTWVDRDRLYRDLRRRGVGIAVLVYDMLPVEHPEWFERSLVEVFDTALTAQASHADLVLAISASSARSFTTWADERGIDTPEPLVVGLGADAVASERSDSGPLPSAPLPPEVRRRRYVLVVGTVEPRKNHTVLLDAMDELRDAAPDLQLVVVGRPGWENDGVVRRLETHPAAGDGIVWFRNADDALLSALYRDALVVAVPSATEGFGLPVIEAFGHGVPVIASDGGALPEAGGELAEYVSPHDASGWCAALGRHATDPEHNRSCREALMGWEPPTWRASAQQVARALSELVPPH